MKKFLILSVLFSVVCGLGVVWATGQHATAALQLRSEVAREAEQLVARNYSGGGPGAAVLVARGDDVLFRSAHGEADIVRHLPLLPDAVFRIGSVTKQFTAAALLTLVEAGKVDLRDPLSKYVPDYPGGNRITVLQLLNHTSGVKNYTSLPGYVDRTIRQDMTTAQIIGLFKSETPDFPPGTQWAYSNSGYVLVGAIIEAASGKPWHAYLEDVLFKPLGLRHTVYGHETTEAKTQVQGYTRTADRVVPKRPMSMTQPHAAGSLVSTIDDLFKWNRALHEGRVVKTNLYAKMITPVGKAADAGIGYGFGLFDEPLRKTRMLQHSGRIFGFAATLIYVPTFDITVVVLQNCDVTLGSDSTETLARRLAAVALGDPYPERRAITIGAPALEEAEAVYRFDAGVVRVLRVVGGKLTSQRNGGSRIVLTPIAVDDFLYDDGFNRVKIEREGGGRIRGIRFYSNGDGDGEFGRRTNEPLPEMVVGMQLPRGTLERLVGTYVNGGLTLKVFLEGEALRAQIAGQPPVSLRAMSPVEFEVEETSATLTFSAGDAPAAEVKIRQNGDEIVLKRLPGSDVGTSVKGTLTSD